MDDAFLRTIASAPDDRLARLVYADWLDEQADPAAAAKSALLRLTAELRADAAGEDDPRRERLRELAAGLDADWLSVVGDPRVEHCAAKRAEPVRSGMRIQFDYVCDKRWDDLAATDADGVRFCGACRENVHYCKTVDEGREHAAAGHCVAVDSRVERRPGDLVLVFRTLGRPAPPRRT